MNLGNTSGIVSIFLGIIEMNSTEFNLLEETSRLELVRDHSGSGFGIGTNLEESYGSYICVMKIVSDDIVKGFFSLVKFLISWVFR